MDRCLVKDLAGVSPFFLFSIMMAAAIAADGRSAGIALAAGRSAGAAIAAPPVAELDAANLVEGVVERRGFAAAIGTIDRTGASPPAVAAASGRRSGWSARASRWYARRSSSCDALRGQPRTA